MKAATVSELKKELALLPPSQLVDICTRLARFKAENKELLTYLLFEASDEASYRESVKRELTLLFVPMNTSSAYLAKKTIRKVLRACDKYMRYSGDKQTQVEVLMHFCKELKESGISIRRSRIISNIYQRQLDRIAKAMSTLHEDLQFDYSEDLDELLLK